MEYIIDTSERTQRSATEQETKTMLYLMGYMKDSKKVDSFIIDAFNDVTAVSEGKDIFWDSQSKGDKSSSPTDIGKELVTLFKNYLSVFQFDYYILSVRYTSSTNLNINRELAKIEVIKYSDFVPEAQKEIKDSLKKECELKTYIKSISDLDDKIDGFLNVVSIVINNEDNTEYVKKVSFMKEDLINENIIKDIFETIRVKQVGIKTSSNINGKKLLTREDAFELNRTITVKSINALILEKIVGHSIISENRNSLFIPIKFNDYTNKYSLDTDELSEVVNDAVLGIYGMLVNENLNKDFWNLIYSILEECEQESTDVYNIYSNIYTKHPNILYLKKATEAELIYLISCVLGGKKE